MNTEKDTELSEEIDERFGELVIACIKNGEKPGEIECHVMDAIFDNIMRGKLKVVINEEEDLLVK